MSASALCLVLGLGCEAATPPRPLAAPGPPVTRASTKPIRRPSASRARFTVPSAFPPGCPAVPPRALRAHFVAAARRYPGGPTACELAKLAYCESRFDPTAVSPAGAGGMFQFVPGTADDLGIDRFDPRAAVFAAARYQRWLGDGWTPPGFAGRTARDIRGLRNGSWNWGRRRMYDDQRANGWNLLDEAMPHLPAETRAFIRCNERGHRRP